MLLVSTQYVIRKNALGQNGIRTNALAINVIGINIITTNDNCANVFIASFIGENGIRLNV
jgi:hypothetical protein